MRYRILGGLVLTVVLAAGVAAATAVQAGADQEFVLTARQTNFEFFPGNGPPSLNPTAPPQSGDRFLIREDLIQNGTTIGFDNIECTDAFNDNGLCTAVFAINGRGDIHATALVRGLFGSDNGPSVFDATIDGGTFAYAQASGMIHLVDVNDTDTQLTFDF